MTTRTAKAGVEPRIAGWESRAVRLTRGSRVRRALLLDLQQA